MAAAGLQGMPRFRRPSFMRRSASFFDQQAAEAQAEAGGLHTAASLQRASADSFRTASGSLPASALRTASGDSLRSASGSLPASRRGSATEGPPSAPGRERTTLTTPEVRTSFTFAALVATRMSAYTERRCVHAARPLRDEHTSSTTLVLTCCLWIHMTYSPNAGLCSVDFRSVRRTVRVSSSAGRRWIPRQLAHGRCGIQPAAHRAHAERRVAVSARFRCVRWASPCRSSVQLGILRASTAVFGSA